MKNFDQTEFFAKKIIDHLGLAAANGSPFVEHRKASNIFKNLQKEARGIETNEDVYLKVSRIKLKGKNVMDCIRELADKVKFTKEDYFFKLKKAMKVWVTLLK
ncbi:hypothetical protein A2774_02640 [Candidatus Roizmanbacteria bacterium RIFCSPHIGHO2_01_FULL_39_12c]|uniref:Uncharacterized protein n=1 Tax=Candidatus Roizmanbacteria bacterium RIFCSPHIGHO2_01_FULL_39_12c TaxID=1802031 RepID=A0A1F7GAV9_9BACT|nr:MAG: hypothetical protein A2774_02640 [Candidatus Roizmanbacteria bacterium RIFCSPHIGHO2_01_FULL_39_12c]